MRRRPPPRILLAFANAPPGDPTHLRSLGQERRALRRRLVEAEAAGLCRVDVEVDATVPELVERLQSPDAQELLVFHYGGHATGDSLALVADDTSEGAHAEGVAQLLASLPRLRLVFLNGCSTQPQVERLLDLGVPAVVATERAIDDATATDFATHFYGRLASGISLQQAFSDAQAAILTQRGDGQALWRARGARSFAPRVPETTGGGLPWALFEPADAEPVDFSLPELVADPLFGLPAVAAPLPPLPFVGVQAYTAQDAGIFLGRQDDVRAVYDALTGPPPAVVLLTGCAGRGKTSLIEAGVLPRLTARLDPMAPTGELSPDRALARALDCAPSEEAVRTAWRQRAEAAAAGDERAPLLVMDPAERCEPEAVFRALSWISEPVQQGLGAVLVSTRTDQAAEIRALLIRANLRARCIDLKPLSRAQITQIVRGVHDDPRLQAAYPIAVSDDLSERLVADLGAATSPAPLVSVVLEALRGGAIRADQEAPRLDGALYDRMFRAGELIGPFLGGQLKTLEATHRDEAESGLALDILAWHTTELGVAVDRSAEQLRALFGHALNFDSLLLALTDLRLLDAVDRADGLSRLASPALARHVRAEYSRSTAPGQQAGQVFQRRVGPWRERGEALDGADLAVVEGGLHGYRSLSDDEEALLAASRAAAAARRADRRQRWLLIALLFVGGISAIVTMLELSGEAEDFRRRARNTRVRHRQVVDEAKSSSERARAAALLMASLGAADPAVSAAFLGELADRKVISGDAAPQATLPLPPDTLAKLHTRGLFQVVPRAVLRGHHGPVTAVAAGLGRRALSASSDNSVRIWPLNGVGDPAVLRHPARVEQVCAVDGSTVGTLASDGAPRLWTKVADNRWQQAKALDMGDDMAQAIRCCGGRLVVASQEALSVWGPPNRRARRLARPGLRRLACLADGRIVTGDAKGQIAVWGPDAAEPLTSYGALQRSVDALVAREEPDGAVLFGVGGPSGFRLLRWRPSDKRGRVKTVPLGRTRSILEGPVNGVAMDSSGRVAVATKAGIYLSTPSGGRRTVKRLADDEGFPDSEAVSIALDPEGASLAAGFADHTVRVWRGRQAPLTLTGHTEPVSVLTYTADGGLLLTSSDDGEVRVWPLHRFEPLEALPAASSIVALAAGPRGVWWADDRKRVGRWDLPNAGRAPTEAQALGGPPRAMAGRGDEVLVAGDTGVLRVGRGEQRPLTQVPAAAAAWWTEEGGDDHPTAFLTDGRWMTWRATPPHIEYPVRPATLAHLTPKGESLALGPIGEGPLTTYVRKPKGAGAPDPVETEQPDGCGAVTAIALGDGGETLAVGCESGAVFGGKPGRRLRRMGRHFEPVRAVAVHPSRRAVASATASTAFFWQRERSAEPIVLDVQQPAGVGFSTDGSRIWVSTRAGGLKGWRTDPARLVNAFADATSACLTPEARLAHMVLPTVSANQNVRQRAYGLYAKCETEHERHPLPLAHTHAGHTPANGVGTVESLALLAGPEGARTTITTATVPPGTQIIANLKFRYASGSHFDADVGVSLYVGDGAGVCADKRFKEMTEGVVETYALRFEFAAPGEPGHYPIRIATGGAEGCGDVRPDMAAVVALPPSQTLRVRLAED